MSAIDIPSGKLVEWLVTRLNLKDDWRKKVNVIREKISQALSDMPESEEIRTLISGTYINYFHCLRILEILKSTESESKNIFGQYSSQRYKDWKDIVYLYEQNHSFLVDCAQILNQNIIFELPAVKKAIEKNNKTISESERLCRLYHSSGTEAAVNMRQLCQQYTVTETEAGKNDEAVRAALCSNLLERKQPLMNRIEDRIEDLAPVLNLYKQFITETISEECADKTCPMLRHLLEKGNTSVYEYHHGEPPRDAAMISSVGEHDSKIPGPDTGCRDDDEISWECMDSVVGLEGDNELDLDFGIELAEDEGVQSKEDMVDDETELRSVLENLETREAVLDDVYELEGFLSCSMDELTTGRGSILDSIECVSEKWPQLQKEHVLTMKQAVNIFISAMTDKSLVHLLQLEISDHYRCSIEAKFARERGAKVKVTSLEGITRQRAIDAREDTVFKETRLEALRGQCRELKVKLEAAISLQFGDRTIRVVGEINTI